MPLHPNIMRHVYGWLLLTPAAILLVAFTHYPTVATFFDSFFSKGSAIRPSKFIGIGNYESMIEDPIFWKVLVNNFWFALGTIPASIALAIAMALLVNRALPGRSLIRMAYFTPNHSPDDRGGEYLAVLLFARHRPNRSNSGPGSGVPGHNWLGDPGYGACRRSSS